MTHDYISLPAYAARVGKSHSTVREMCQRGSIPGAQKIGRNWLIPADTPYTDHRIKSGAYINARKKKEG